MRKIFFNATQHVLTELQMTEANKMASVIRNIQEFPIFENVKETPDDPEEINKLVLEFINFLNSFVNKEGADTVYLHLPIGSPYFLATFIKNLQYLDKRYCILFSHTKRKSVEKMEDNKVIKTKVFEFEKFIEFKY
ncbi:MAG: hypothetical protein N2505_06510 [Endomicrobia bacterium]|nr:hypothetical protein [Endomicrobiia bacterium]